MRQTLRRLLLAAALLLLAGQTAHARVGVQPPERIVGEFYEWYLGELAASRYPLTDARQTLASYVARSLLRQIERRMNSKDGLEADYFIQAQDYLDDWPAHIAVTPPTVKGRVATARVTLGASAASRTDLDVTLGRDAHDWKITRVRRPAAALAR